jgi:hypothetical protein
MEWYEDATVKKIALSRFVEIFGLKEMKRFNFEF